MVGMYPVITLCGSTRFKEQFLEAQKRLTLDGNIVISVGLFGHSGDDEVWTEGTKAMLDDMHKRKIDMADGIFVINVGGYIGESTRSEIEYAKRHGKGISYLETPSRKDDSVSQNAAQDSSLSLLDGFNLFDPQKDNPKVIPEAGNYIMCLRDGRSLPGADESVRLERFEGLRVIYTGVSATNLRGRINHDHFKGHSSFSTFRISLGCLMGFKLIPRDRVPDGKHFRFSSEDEAALSTWMKENILVYQKAFPDYEDMEGRLIDHLKPPLNLDKNFNLVNMEFREGLRFLRSQHP